MPEISAKFPSTIKRSIWCEYAREFTPVSTDVIHAMLPNFGQMKFLQPSQIAMPLEIPFTTFHINDAPPDVTQAASGNYPIVLGRTQTGLQVLLTDAELKQCAGSQQALLGKLQNLLQ